MKSRRPLAPAAWARSTTGRRAFEGTDVTDTLAAVLRSEPDWTVLPANVPPGVQQLVTGCLVKDRRDRIRDLSTALYLFDPKALAAPEPAPVAMPATPPRRPSTATLLIATGNNQGAGFDVLPDGRFLVLRRPDPVPCAKSSSSSVGSRNCGGWRREVQRSKVRGQRLAV